MRKTDIDNLSPLVYGRAHQLKRELAAFVSYVEMNKLSSANALETWWLGAKVEIEAALAAASPQA